MYRTIKISLLLAFILTILHAEEELQQESQLTSVRQAIDSFGKIQQKEVSIVDKFKGMFTDGKVSAQIRFVYAGYEQKADASTDTYATALGGQLKYELASLNGFNAALAFTTSQDIGFATGDTDRNNDELSSLAGNYTQVSEAYINYVYDDLNFRGGRQVIDTPLADSDDIRMVQNTFEAYIATYNISDFSFTAGNLQHWQGVDAGLDEPWVKTGEEGTWFGGVTYSSVVNFSAWYYNITQLTNATYADIDYTYEITKDISFFIAMQYLHESELNNSAIEADIYGALAEFSIYGIGFNLAYNKSDKKENKESFSGFGGGTLFTSMDTMILNEIAKDREAVATVGGIIYTMGDLSFLYAYGDFVGEADGSLLKAHIVEQNMGFEYNVNEEFVVAAIYALEEDKESIVSNENDWSRLQVMLQYNF